jgi:hypothetical protein
MTIAPDLVAQILRLHTVEKWRVGTIARQLHVHRDAVRRVLAGNRAPVHTSPLRPSRIDPYRPFILATLEKFPTLTAARLHAMVAERGYVGGPSHFRLLVAQMRPRPPAQAFLRLRTLPGEQAQVDWGHFGHLQIGRARRALMAFVMVLSHSRMVFLRFFLDARMDSFLRGHALAFVAFGGVPVCCCTTTSRAPCSNAWIIPEVRRSASTRRCWPWPATTASSHARWPRHAATRRAAWNAPSATSARASSPGAASRIWTI